MIFETALSELLKGLSKYYFTIWREAVLLWNIKESQLLVVLFILLWELLQLAWNKRGMRNHALAVPRGRNEPLCCVLVARLCNFLSRLQQEIAPDFSTVSFQ